MEIANLIQKYICVLGFSLLSRSVPLNKPIWHLRQSNGIQKESSSLSLQAIQKADMKSQGIDFNLSVSTLTANINTKNSSSQFHKPKE